MGESLGDRTDGSAPALRGYGVLVATPSSPGPRAAVHLRRTDENAAEIAAITGHGTGTPVGMSGVVADLDRRGVRARVPGACVEWGFRWNDADVATARWWPQGITTSADAGDPEDIGPDEVDGRRLLVTSWYSKTVDGVNHGSRITVVDIDTLEYRHVLLVTPEITENDVALRPLLVHAGGLVWCGPYLHVAGTRRGLFSARMDDIVRVEDPSRAFGYRYVLPVRFGYDARSEQPEDGPRGPMRYSFLSLDRSADPPQLVAGEYGTEGMTQRLVRYPLDPVSFHLHAEEDGTSWPISLDEEGLGHMQGAAVVRGRYYVTTSHGRWRLGSLHVGTPGAFRRWPRAIPVGPEDISYWPSQDLLWSLTEYPGRRFVFCLRRSQFD